MCIQTDIISVLFNGILCVDIQWILFQEIILLVLQVLKACISKGIAVLHIYPK